MKKVSPGGKIAVSPRLKTLQTSNLDNVLGMGDVYQDCQAERSTENGGLARTRAVPVLTPLHEEIALLERMGLDPDYLPDYPCRARHPRPIYGKALWGWIGKQPGITLSATEVEGYLKEIENILQLEAETE